jgi:hypothetical protein
MLGRSRENHDVRFPAGEPPIGGVLSENVRISRNLFRAEALCEFAKE